MAPEVIACDENPEATYDNRVSIYVLYFHLKFFILLNFCMSFTYLVLCMQVEIY